MASFVPTVTVPELENSTPALPFCASANTLKMTMCETMMPILDNSLIERERFVTEQATYTLAGPPELEGREASVKEERTGELSRSPPASESRSLLTTFTHGALGAQGEEIHLTTVGPVAAFAGM